MEGDYADGELLNLVNDLSDSPLIYDVLDLSHQPLLEAFACLDVLSWDGA
jgi:hypothetical protein